MAATVVTPPTKGFVFNAPLLERAEEGSEGKVGVRVGSGTNVRVGVTVLGVGTMAGVLIIPPGKISGVSPTRFAVVGLQYSAAGMSRRTQCGMRVPAGTGLGNVAGARIVEQFR